jgi:hypothetical protein
MVDVMIVPDETEMKDRARRRHERFQRMGEGKSKRFKRRMERIERTCMVEEVPKVRVLPKNDEIRKILVHPNGNLAFREHGSVEWPLDQFTLRRLRDGDVTLDESHAQQPVRRPPQQRTVRPQPPPPAGETG